MIQKRRVFLRPLAAGFILLALLFVLTGCGAGLPKGLKKQANALKDSIKSEKEQIETHQKNYARLSGSVEFKAVAPYAERENWVEKFTLARKTLARAQDLFENDLQPLIKENKPELAPRVKQEITRIQSTLKEADQQARYPADRFARITASIRNMSGLNSEAIENAGEITRITDRLKAGILPKSLADFQELSDEINARFRPLLELEKTSRELARTAAAQYARHTDGTGADYALFTDSVTGLSQNRKEAASLEKKFSGEMAQLYTSYTKVLKDMKEEYFVTVKRESWNENSDYYNPGFATFQRQVSPETYEILNSDSLDTIAAIQAGFLGSKLSTQIDNKIWQELAINPTEHWPRRDHNAASFWVEDSKEVYYHKYILEENGETRETGWEKVDEAFYEQNFDYLGMAILSKPYGVFEKDRETQAAPPGMAYVGNPRYGEWKEDNSGDRFWSWYGRYAFFSSLFFFPPSYYHYNSWNGWRTNYRGRQPYFGKTADGFQKYGTQGTYVKKSPKFQSTTFAKSGGFRSQTASVRGAGPGLRGGGPKSKGK